MKSALALLGLFFIFVAEAAIALPAGWREIAPGGDTLCARGSAFKFLVRPGDPQKVLVSFAGGGACWDDFTCESRQIYADTVERTYGPINEQRGIYNTGDTNNPYYGWTMIFVPYCTGDAHLGSADTTYQNSKGKPFTIHHRGGTNTRAVLKWMEQNYPAAAEINVDGCSAGAYGSVVWTPAIAETYKYAQILQFGDSGAGISDSLFFPGWGMDKNLPSWIPALNPALIQWDKLSLVEVYRHIASYYPLTKFSQFNHEKDRVQTMFYAAKGGAGVDWSDRMFKSMEDISMTTPNFRYFVAPGNQHCEINKETFFATKSDGVGLKNWLQTAISGQDSQNVKCLECKTKVK